MSLLWCDKVRLLPFSVSSVSSGENVELVLNEDARFVC